MIGSNHVYKETSGEISAQKKRALSYGGWIGIGSNDLWPTEIILYWKYARQVLNSWKTGVKKYYRDITLCGELFLRPVRMRKWS